MVFKPTYYSSESTEAARVFAQNAAIFAENAEQSATIAQQSQQVAEQSVVEANIFAGRAHESEINAAVSATFADNSAQSAISSAQIATNKANEAQQSATNAAASELVAKNKATEASVSASNAASSAADANRSMAAASTSATNATAKATAAANSAANSQSNAIDANTAKIAAQTAQRLAEEAKTSAQQYGQAAELSAANAAASESAAAQSATAAGNSASAAHTSELNASASAGAAAGSANDAQAAADSVLNMTVSADTLPSGSDASVTKSVVDDAVHLAFGIPQGAQGVQGEQGVQGPTGATPNFTIGTVQTLLPTQDATATITGTAEAPVLNLGIPKGATGEVSEAELTAALENKAGAIIDTASGSIVSVYPDKTVPNVYGLTAGIDPAQDLHGYDSPWPAGGGTNLIPLTVDTIKAANGGANTWNGNSKTINGVTYTILTDEAGNVTGINANGTATAAAKLKLGTIHAVSGTTYGIKKFNADDGGNFFGNINPRFSSATDANIYGNTTMTADSDKDVAVSYYIMSGGVANNRLITPFIAVTSIAPTVFAPYSNICPISGSTGLSVYVSPTQDLADATTYTEDWTSAAGAVYGGTLDVVTGELTVTMVSVDLGSLNWTKNQETALIQDWRTADISSLIENPAASEAPNALCDRFKTMSRNAMNGVPNSIGVTRAGNIGINTEAGAYPDKYAFKAAMSGVQVVYKLATPLTYQLTPQEVELLVGQNYVWADTGDVSVEYAEDLKHYIDSKIAAAVAAMN